MAAVDLFRTLYPTFFPNDADSVLRSGLLGADTNQSSTPFAMPATAATPAPSSAQAIPLNAPAPLPQGASAVPAPAVPAPQPSSPPDTPMGLSQWMASLPEEEKQLWYSRGTQDKDAFKELYSAYKDYRSTAEKGPAEWKQKLIDAGFTPGTPEYREALKQILLKPDVAVTMGNLPPGTEIVTTPSGEKVLKELPIERRQGEMTEAMRNELVKKRSGFSAIEKTIKNYEDVVTQTGPQFFGSLIGSQESARLNTAYKALLLEVKNLGELGALTGPDYGILQDMITDPSTVQALHIGPQGLAEQIKQASAWLKGKRDAMEEEYRIPVSQPSPSGGTQAAPSAPGYRPVGRHNGEPVYEDSRGRRFKLRNGTPVFEGQ